MAIEIERKFIVKGDFSKDIIRSRHIRQGYISSQPGRTVRIRIIGEKAYLTIKGPSDEKGLSRYEFEQEILLSDAEELFKLCEPGAIIKERHWAIIGKNIWEIDVFEGDNKGLVIAEIELTSENDLFDIPPWLGKEVSGDSKYYNSMLMKNPYLYWENKE